MQRRQNPKGHAPVHEIRATQFWRLFWHYAGFRRAPRRDMFQHKRRIVKVGGRMIGPAYAQSMARYNAWQNHSLYTAAASLDDAAREADRGAFWGGIRRTLAHLAWGDTLWISRFDGGDGPALGNADAIEQFDWAFLWTERPKLDARIAGWAWMTDASDFEGELSWYSGFLGREMSMPKALCVMQLFNHQTHHRGQVHAMLTAAGAKPDETDLQLMPDDVPEWV